MLIFFSLSEKFNAILLKIRVLDEKDRNKSVVFCRYFVAVFECFSEGSMIPLKSLESDSGNDFEHFLICHL